MKPVFKNACIVFTCIALSFLNACREHTTTLQATNPTYTPHIEQRIARVMGQLQVATAIEGQFRRDSLYQRMQYYHTPGLSIAVINDGKLEWARGFGVKQPHSTDSVDIHTLFQAGSVSKPVFALAVMKLKQEGKLDLDTDVNQYLRSWKVPANDDWQPVLTLRQLLSHTAGTTVHGFPGYMKGEPIPTVPQVLNGSGPANTSAVRVNILPGTQFRYSGGGTTIAQLTISDHLRKPFPALIKENLFDPLHLPYSTYQQDLPKAQQQLASTAFPWKGQPLAGGHHFYPEMAAAGLWTNPSELANLILEVQKGYTGRSTFFSKATIEEMLTPQKVAPHIGIGFFLESKGDSARFSHNGWDEGFVALVSAYKTAGKGAIIMVNSNEGYGIMDEIVRAIAREYHWPDFLPSARKPARESQDKTDYSGNYYDKDSLSIKIAMVNQQLQLLYQHQPAILLQPSADNYYYSPTLNLKVYLKEKELRLEQEGNSHVYKRK